MNNHQGNVLIARMPIEKARAHVRTRSDRKRQKQKSPLASLIYRNEILEIPRENVEAYMAQKLDALKNPKKTYRQERQVDLWWSGVGCILIAGTIFLVWLPVLVYLSIFTIGLIALIRGLVGKKITIDITPHAKHQAEWKTMPLEDYVKQGHRVPPQILARTADLKRQLPALQPVVHYLYEDPFLELVVKNPLNGSEEGRFTEFWDEKFVLP